MKALAKLGFTMSYTYFTWKNTGWELREYLEEMTQTPMAEYFRGNLFANTPDILNEYLVHGGRAAFRVRLVLASTLLPSYGIYSGYELFENVPVRPGSEEYLDSEKYQIKPRDWEAPGNLNAEIQRMNQIRRQHRALQLYSNLTFHGSDNPNVLFYRKAPTETLAVPGHVLRHAVNGVLPETDASQANDILVAVNLDPLHVQETMVEVPIGALGIGDDETYVMNDLLTGARYSWRGARNYVRLEPPAQVAHVFRVEK
jgi:starch synthase (maltosyl-transferring)